jgi:holo-[acyl-carrier protein] synthase
MIIGIGNDLLDIRRVQKVLDRHGDRFIKRCFTPTEIAKAERRRAAGTHVDTYAKRFAAKEAMVKALGTGFSQGVFMKDIGVVNEISGKPTIVLTGGALAHLQTLTPEGKTTRIHLAITDEPPMVQAFVIIEAV